MKTLRWVLAALMLLTVAGCTGVPTSSSPEVVRTVGLGEQARPSAPAPPVGADRRQIVTGFLDALVTSPDRLDAARAYLDDDAAKQWSGATVTVVNDLRVRSENAADSTVPVSYQIVGTLQADGEYQPRNLNSSTAESPVTFTLAKNAAGQWRIRSLPQGLILSEADFARLYVPKPIYFFNLSNDRLVPDLRYSALNEPSLESFLLTQLVAGARTDLTNAVNPFAPQPSGAQRVSVTPGTPTVVQVPGAASLDGPARQRLAAQLAYTLPAAVSFQSELEIHDGNQIVSVPGVSGPFDADNFPDVAPVDTGATTTVTYVRDGAVIDAAGKAVQGPLGSGTYDLDTAVFDNEGGRTLVAGTTGARDGGSARTLLIGGPTALVPAAGLPTTGLSPPAWAPTGSTADPDEVWVAAGSQLYRVTPGKRAVSVQVSTSNGLQIGTIRTISFSPEGSRVAPTVANGATAQVWVGAVVRSGPDVTLDAVRPITPVGYVVRDVGWRTETRLAAVATAVGYSVGVYLDLWVDGSQLDPSSPDALPDSPRTIAVSPRSSAQWVTVGTTVWSRTSTSGPWSPPVEGGSQTGSAPSFGI